MINLIIDPSFNSGWIESITAIINSAANVLIILLFFRETNVYKIRNRIDSFGVQDELKNFETKSIKQLTITDVLYQTELKAEFLDIDGDYARVIIGIDSIKFDELTKRWLYTPYDEDNNVLVVGYIPLVNIIKLKSYASDNRGSYYVLWSKFLVLTPFDTRNGFSPFKKISYCKKRPHYLQEKAEFHDLIPYIIKIKKYCSNLINGCKTLCKNIFL